VTVRIINADVMDGLAQLESESVHCVVTSPPYFGLRDYGMPGQIGLEPTPDAYVAKMVEVFREVRRVLRKDGTCWLNLGDSYSAGGRGCDTAKQRSNAGTGIGAVKGHWSVPGFASKQLLGIPWRVAFALQADGWWLRQDIIWSKPNPMPESVTDRCTKAHEYLFLLTKAERYFYDAAAIKQPAAPSSFARLAQDIDGQRGSDRVPGKTNGTMKAVYGGKNKHDGCGTRIHSGNEDDGGYLDAGVNRRSVWEVATQPFSEAHFATFPPALIDPCIKAGCPEGGTVLDPFGGSETTGLVADRLKRSAILIELNPEYAAMAERRVKGDCPMFAEVQL
jgi:DNA modification methylase